MSKSAYKKVTKFIFCLKRESMKGKHNKQQTNTPSKGFKHTSLMEQKSWEINTRILQRNPSSFIGNELLITLHFPTNTTSTSEKSRDTRLFSDCLNVKIDLRRKNWDIRYCKTVSTTRCKSPHRIN